MSSQRKIPVSEVTQHATPEDCWMVVNGQVYDLSRFAPEHPGGPEVIWKWAGKDASVVYNSFHSSDLIETTISAEDKIGEFDTSSITSSWIAASKSEQSPAPTDINPASQRPPLSSLLNLTDFEKSFSQHGPAKAWAYIHSGSNDLLTLEANKTWWQKIWFRPRVMRDVSRVNTHSSLLGSPVTMPVYIAPMGIALTAGPEGERALGAGAAATGIIHCMATTASLSVQDILSSVPETYPYFYQLYIDRDRRKTEARLASLESMPQIKAIFVTADLAVVSKREADERLRLTSNEVNSTATLRNAVEANSSPEKKKVAGVGGGLARTTGGFIDPALSWDDFAWLRRHTSKPLIIKGIQTAADAKRALKEGCRGIVISNHGGRALDSAPGTVGVLLEIKRDAPEVLEKMDVFIDGGVRRGSDVLKAILLGARGVGVGRPFQCAVAYGRDGVQAASEILLDELETAMRLCGITDLDAVRGKAEEYLNTSELEMYLPPRPRSSPSSVWSMLGGAGRRRQSKL